MIAVKKEGILLQKTTLDFENAGVLNPAVISEGVLFTFFIERWLKAIAQASAIAN